MTTSAETAVSESPAFSDRLAPVFVKELQQGLRARRFVAPFLWIQIMVILVVLLEYLAIREQGTLGSGSSVFSFASRALFQVVLGVVFLLIMPLTGFGALRPELGASRNVELLLMANLTRWQIVRGKWLVMGALSGLVMISILPYELARYFFGGVDLAADLGYLFQLLTSNLALNALIIGASGFRNLIGALLVLGLAVGSYFISSGISAASVMAHSAWAGATSGQVGAIVVAGLGGAAVDFLYVVCGLQLGRAQLRLFHNPVDPPPAGQLIAMLLFTPILIGVPAAAVGGWGGAGIAALVMGLLLLRLDPGPGKKSGPQKREGQRFLQP